jgi:S-DNA-T family DNA segregation ATPase FtsK/SpoIIIE
MNLPNIDTIEFVLFKNMDKVQQNNFINTLDAAFDKAAKLIVKEQLGSTSLLQRRMRMGYNRAGRLIDQMEVLGIVGVYNDAKARVVLIKTKGEINNLLNELKSA